MKDQEPSEASGSQSAPEFRTVKNALEIPGMIPRACRTELAELFGVSIAHLVTDDLTIRQPQETTAPQEG